jgi:hypothetical protein
MATPVIASAPAETKTVRDTLLGIAEQIRQESERTTPENYVVVEDKGFFRVVVQPIGGAERK